MSKQKIIALIVACAILAGAVAWFGVAKALAVALVAIACFLTGWWFGATKSDSVKRRLGGGSV